MLLTVSPTPSGPGRLLSRWCWFYSPLTAWRRNTRKESMRIQTETKKENTQSMRADRGTWAKTPWDSSEKKNDGWMGPKIRERGGRECEGERDKRAKQIDTGEGREGETGEIGGSGCEKQEEDRLLGMESDRLLNRERDQEKTIRWSAIEIQNWL